MNKKCFNYLAGAVLFVVLGGCHLMEQKGQVYEQLDISETGDAKEYTGADAILPIQTERVIYVQVCGAVKVPGVYEVLEGTRLFEVLRMAGGPVEDGDIQQLSLAKTVTDGERIQVPFIGEEAHSDMEEYVNINTAGISELMSLPGIGQTRASDIVQYRQDNGSFQCIEDIMQVPGIKEAAFNKIKDKIRV